MKILSSLLLLFACSISLQAGEELRLDLEVGETYTLTNEVHMKYFQSSDMEKSIMNTNITYYLRYKVLEQNDEDLFIINFSIDRVTVNQKMQGRTIIYDSNLEEQEGMGAMMSSQIAPLLRDTISLKVSERGEVVETSQNKAAGIGVSMAQVAKSLFVPFPEKEVKEGESWTQKQEGMPNVSVNMHYTLKHHGDDDQFTLSFSADESDVMAEGAAREQTEDMKLKNSGTLYFDEDSGRILSGNSKQMVEMNNPQMGGKVFMVTNTSISSK